MSYINVVILSSDDFQSVMSNVFRSSTSDVQLWNPVWVSRYSVLIKCRGIIKSKGYLMRAIRDIKKLPYTLGTGEGSPIISATA